MRAIIRLLLPLIGRPGGPLSKGTPGRKGVLVITEQNETSTDGSELQFERAEFADGRVGALACQNCKQPIALTYFQVNGNVVCPDCREETERTWTESSGLWRFVRASFNGVLAAFTGAVLAVVASRVTGHQFTFIAAIVIGIMVGRAVSCGSNARGGWLYQGLAMFLTYCGIVGTFVPVVMTTVVDSVRSKDSVDHPVASSGKPSTAESKVPPSEPARSASRVDRLESPEHPVLGFALFGAVLFGLAFFLPFLAVFQGKDIIWVLVFGYGLYEAWRLNQKLDLVVTGPWQLGRSNPPGKLTEASV